MLRLNEACRPRHSETEVSFACIVRPISSRPSSLVKGNTSTSSGDAYVKGEFLRQLGVRSGTAILLQRTCGEKRLQVAVRLKRIDDLPKIVRGDTTSDSNETVFVSTFTYLQLTEAGKHKEEDPLCQEQEFLTPCVRVHAVCSPLLERNIRKAQTVDLRLLAKCDGFDFDKRNRDETALPLPPSGSLLWLGAVVPVVSKERRQLCTYRVEDIASSGSLAHDEQIWYSDEITAFKAVDEPEKSSLDVRLPPVTETVDWLLERQPTKLPQHPDTSYWISAFRSPRSVWSIPVSSRVWHVVGDNVDVAIRIATDRWGYPMKTIRGLAAHAFEHGHTVTMAGIVDKLAGLNYLDDHFGPIVILLQDVDAEFRSNDERHRFLDVLSTKMGPKTRVVLHTRRDDRFLPEFLVFPTFHASLPDGEYAAFLWNKHNKRIEQSSHDSTSLRALLQGRPDHEIACLHCRYWAKCTHTSKLELDAELLETLCAEFDAEQRKKSDAGEIPSVHWDDVGGVDHVRKEIMDAIELPIKYPELFSNCVRNGILLYGPPGTGKTLVAKAVATECQLPFLSVKGPELLGSYVGESEANVRSTFAKARRLANRSKPCGCVLFFDELDSLAPRRGETSSNGNVMDRVVSTLFSELDSRDPDASVFCIGATNRPDLLDPALLRPGRFNRLVYLGVAPENQAAILKAQLGKVRLGESLDFILEGLCRDLPKNLTGADLASVVSGAVVVAMQRLCHRADKELYERIERGEGELTIDDVLASWPEHELEPTVQYNDFITASNDITSSVSESELLHYEQLRDTYDANRQESPG